MPSAGALPPRQARERVVEVDRRAHRLHPVAQVEALVLRVGLGVGIGDMLGMRQRSTSVCLQWSSRASRSPSASRTMPFAAMLTLPSWRRASRRFPGLKERLIGHRFQNPCDGIRNARLKREDAFSHAMIIVSSAMVSSS